MGRARLVPRSARHTAYHVVLAARSRIDVHCTCGWTTAVTIESDAAEVHPARVVTAQRRHRARVRRRWVRSQLLTLVSIILVTVMAALAAWGLDYELLD